MRGEYRFTRGHTGAYVVTVPHGDGLRLLDGAITTHARGAVVCCELAGADALLTADVCEAWRAWWDSTYDSRNKYANH